MAHAQYSFKENFTKFSINLGGGVLQKSDYHCPTFNLGATLFGFTINADMGMSGGSDGEHVYGPGDRAEDPVLYQMMFGFQFPIYGTLHKEYKGFVICLTPLYGWYAEDYESSDNYYGKPLHYDSVNKSSYGGILSLRFGRYLGAQYNVQITNHGWNLSIGFSMGDF